MNKHLVFFVVVLFTFSVGVCNALAIRGSGNVVSETREVRDFESVSVSGFGELNITQGSHESLTIETDDNLMSFIRTRVRNRTLRIDFVRGVNLRPTETIKYYLTVKEIGSLSISGSCEVDASALRTDKKMDISVSGSGDIRIDSLGAQDLKIGISGSGDIRIDSLAVQGLKIGISGSGDILMGSGNVVNQEITINGSGTYEAPDLESQEAVIGLSGSGDAVVWATATLSVNMSGSGEVKYYGRPGVTSDTSGSGSIIHLGDK